MFCMVISLIFVHAWSDSTPKSLFIRKTALSCNTFQYRIKILSREIGQKRPYLNFLLAKTCRTGVRNVRKEGAKTTVLLGVHREWHRHRDRGTNVPEEPGLGLCL